MKAEKTLLLRTRYCDYLIVGAYSTLIVISVITIFVNVNHAKRLCANARHTMNFKSKVHHGFLEQGTQAIPALHFCMPKSFWEQLLSHDAESHSVDEASFPWSDPFLECVHSETIGEKYTHTGQDRIWLYQFWKVTISVVEAAKRAAYPSFKLLSISFSPPRRIHPTFELYGTRTSGRGSSGHDTSVLFLHLTKQEAVDL